MSNPNNKLLLRDFYRALPLSAQGGSNQSGIYVNRACDEGHDPVARLRQDISWELSDFGSTYLFSGLRGSGKTTELNRLIEELRDQDQVAAYYCDVSDYLNLNDPQLSLPDLLMTVLAGLADAVRRAFGADCLGNENSIWSRISRTLHSDVTFKPKLKAGTPGASIEIEAALKENPDFRSKLNQFACDSSAFYDEASRFAAEVVALIQEKSQCDKVVLVVDSLERLSAPTGEEFKLFDSLKAVFFNEPARLRFPGLSIIYTAPPYLETVLPNVRSGFNSSLSISNFKVIQRSENRETPGECSKAAEGIRRMVEIIGHRFTRWEEVLTRQVLEHLAWMSGGNVRRYFSLIQNVASKAALAQVVLPIADADSSVIRDALSQEAQPLQWLTAPDRKWLKFFKDNSRNPVSEIEDIQKDLPSIIRLFDHSLVLDYQNGSLWYQVPPLVRDYV